MRQTDVSSKKLTALVKQFEMLVTRPFLFVIAYEQIQSVFFSWVSFLIR
jgi:serine protease inhibitor